jgi:3-methyladenine DNA glycosylase AlkD|tara:strand:- start:1120 stop:1803 length:684 start_codon:yes stop_codon:yes gene_type:complete
MQRNTLLNKLKNLSNPDAVVSMAKFGINSKNTYGISIPILRGIAKEIGRDHDLAQQIWDSGIHEARILASMIADPSLVTESQLEKWVMDFDSWDVCDQCCMNLFEDTDFAYLKCFEWSSREEEFVKRAGFVLMARLAVSDKKAEDNNFFKFFHIIKRESIDDRNYVKKSINWALRQIGKRSPSLNKIAITFAEEIKEINSSSAKWVGSDALKELKSKSVQKRFNKSK